MKKLLKFTCVAIVAGTCFAQPDVAAKTATPSLGDVRRLIDRGQPQQALAALDSISHQQLVPRGVSRLRGDALYAQNHLAEADQSYAKALTEDPADQDAAQMRALTVFRLGRPAEAIPLLVNAHDLQPGSKVDPSYLLALCYLDTRRYDDARHAFATQYGFPPDSAAAYLLAGRMLLRREFVPVAEQFARKAVELDPQLPLAHELLGEIALAGNHLPEAIAQLEQERARNPLNAAIYDRLGDAYTRSGDYPKAVQSLQRAVLLEPTSTGPYILLGKVYLKQSDPVSASSFLERAVKMDPGNFMTHSLLGQAYRGLGRMSDATREAATAQQIQAASEPKLQGVQ